jgi:uroporphyrinogen decarboxylase
MVKIEETDEVVIYLDGNGAKMKHHKLHASTPGHVDYKIYDRKTWEELARPGLSILNRSRIPFAAYRKLKKSAAQKNRYFMSDAFGPFEMMHRILGHEVLLLNMAMDPAWIKDMVEVYTEFNIRHWEVLFAEEGLPHGTWIAEDLGYKFKPFMSPAMFEDLLLPSFVRMFDYLHARGLTVFMHSCGFIEPLLPALIDAGLDCYEAIEAKAGNDLSQLFSKFGDRLVYFGNIDMRVLESNDLNLIKKELKEKIEPVIRNGGRYILHSDHSISPKVEYDTYRAFLEAGRSISQ